MRTARTFKWSCCRKRRRNGPERVQEDLIVNGHGGKIALGLFRAIPARFRARLVVYVYQPSHSGPEYKGRPAMHSKVDAHAGRVRDRVYADLSP